MTFKLISYDEELLCSSFRFYDPRPYTGERYIESARDGVLRMCEVDLRIEIDRAVMEDVTRPNLLSVVIGPNTNYLQFLAIIGRKFIENYNYALKQKYQGKVA